MKHDCYCRKEIISVVRHWCRNPPHTFLDCLILNREIKLNLTIVMQTVFCVIVLKYHPYNLFASCFSFESDRQILPNPYYLYKKKTIIHNKTLCGYSSVYSIWIYNKPTTKSSFRIRYCKLLCVQLFGLNGIINVEVGLKNTISCLQNRPRKNEQLYTYCYCRYFFS